MKIYLCLCSMSVNSYIQNTSALNQNYKVHTHARTHTDTHTHIYIIICEDKSGPAIVIQPVWGFETDWDQQKTGWVLAYTQTKT